MTAAVIVTYNRKALLKKCVERVLSQKNASCDVIVVDNASTDGTEQMVKEMRRGDSEGGKILYFNTGANLGGAGGFTYGTREAVRQGYEYIWLMDDDTLPEEDTLASFFKADTELKEKWGFLSSVAYWTDGSICRMNIQKKDIFRHVGEKEYQMEMAPIKMCSFVSLLVRSDVVKEVGLPIGEYFIWTDDYEFTGRISKKFPCYMIPDSKVIHAMKNHLRVNFAQDDASRIDRYHYIYRNDVHCYRQYGLSGWSYIILKDLYTVLNILINSKERRMDKIKVVIQGFLEGIQFDPTIEMIGMDRGGGKIS